MEAAGLITCSADLDDRRCTRVQRRSSRSAEQVISPAASMVRTIRVTEGGCTCSATARSPNEGLRRLSIDANIEACAGEIPPRDDDRRRRLRRVTARRSRAAVSFVVALSISSPN
jgi:hypothetical protein